MAKIISIDGDEVKIGGNDGQVTTVNKTMVKYAGAKVGDEVEVYRDGEGYIVTTKGNASAQQTADVPEGGRSFEKNIFVWVFAFLLGGWGVDRFVRGQIGTGVCKLLFGWCTLGIWGLVDWINAMVKAYGSAYGNSADLVFDAQGKYTR